MKPASFSRNLVLSWSGVIVVLLTWQVASAFQWVKPSLFPGPLQVLQVSWATIPLSDLAGHILTSLARVATGFGIGTFLGIAIGIASGWYRRLGTMVWAPLDLLRPIPPLAWISMALIWFGLGETSKVFIIFLGAFFPIVTSTFKGMTHIDPDLIRAAQTLGVKGWRILTKIAIPASLPDIAVGLRVGWSMSFGSLVAAEILAADKGLGYMIMYARELGNISVIIYGIVIIGILNLVTDFLVQEFILKRRLRWHFGIVASE